MILVSAEVAVLLSLVVFRKRSVYQGAASLLAGAAGFALPRALT